MPSKAAVDYYYRTVNWLAPNSEHEQYFYARTLHQQLRPGMVWLDAGCGRKLVPNWLKHADALEQYFLSTARFIVGCDVDFKSLAGLRPITCIACNLEELAFRESSFDLITCNMVVEHLERPGSVFREFFRVLKPGGMVINLTPNLYHWTTLVSAVTPHGFHRLFLRALCDTSEEDVFPTRYRCNTAKALRKALTASGFSQVVIHTVVGRPRLIGLGPLLYLECLARRFTQRFPLLHEVLWVQAIKPPPHQT